MELATIIILGGIFLAREYVHRLEMKEEAEQRNMLLQRIQAPREIAYKEFQETLPPGAPSEPIWSDEDAWKALGHLPVSATDQARAIDRVAQDETEMSEWERRMRLIEATE